MRLLLLIVTTICVNTFCIAQNTLSKSVKNSHETQVYAISAATAKKLFSSDMQKLDEKLLTNLVTEFTDKDDDPNLEPGNYLFVSAVKNRLQAELITIGDVHYKILNNNHDFIVLVHKANGEIIKDAEVRVKNRKVPFNKDLQAFMIKGYNKPGMVKIKAEKALFAFLTDKNDRYRSRIRFGFNRYYFRSISYRFPLKYILYPARKIKQKIKYGWKQKDRNYEDGFSNVFVLNKPLYKPNDTLKLKAFIQSKKGKLYDEPLFVRIRSHYPKIDTVLGRIQPYRPGGYEYSFVLNDGLGLQLDKIYQIYLEEDTAGVDKTIALNNFKYEDYELKSITFNARADKEKHVRGMTNAVYLRATDENNMAVMDGRIELTIKTQKHNSIDFKAPKVFLPDTLWSHKQTLDPLGETKIEIPDSIFPKATFDYIIDCEFLNANNELQTKSLNAEFKDEAAIILFKKEQDSLFIDYKLNGKSTPINATMIALNNNEDTVEQKSILLPASVKINPFAVEYEIEADSLYEYFEIEKENNLVSCNAMRTKDSIYVQLVNPKKLKVWYTIFQKNRVIDYGYGEELFYKAKTHTQGNYFVSLQYVYADETHNEEFTVPYRDKLLNISTDQPKNIYPGQKTTINIDVKDVNGKPVEDADVTAYAFTTKFKNASAANIPYFGKRHKERKAINALKVSDEDIETETTLKMNWQKWSRELNLDTIEYYKFLHPKGVYVNREAAKDSITQIAPFVVIDGDLQPIHQIYIDERPVFFSQATQLQRYSFKVFPGKHSLKLRTHNSMVKVDSIHAAKGMKTFLSFDTKNPAGYVHVEKFLKKKKPSQFLTDHEMSLWNKYMILVNNSYDENFSYIRQHEDIYLLNRPDFYNKPVLAGPLPNTASEFIVKNSFNQYFDVEGSYIYNISYGLIKQKQLPTPLFSRYLSQDVVEYDFKDMALSEKEIDSLWQELVDRKVASEDYQHFQTGASAEVRIGIENQTALQIKNILLFKKSNADFLRVYRGSTRNLSYLAPGDYRILLLLKNNDYIVYDSLAPKPGGINYYLIPTGKIKKADSLSLSIYDALQNRFNGAGIRKTEENLNQIKSSFNKNYFQNESFKRTVSGFIKDIKGNPVADASVNIKNTAYGTTTDEKGWFNIKVPQEGTLVFSMVGYDAQEEKIITGKNYNVVLMPLENRLEEVVVVGYGTQRKTALTGSITTINHSDALSGRVPGLAITGTTGASTTIRIRGTNTSYNFNNEPLIIIDGVPVSKGLMENLTADDIKNISVLKDAAATAIYGARGANGVIIISSKEGALAKNDAFSEFVNASNSLRSDFKDDAFWQPKLRTDKNGRASFTTVFPDDITAWKTYYIAMGDNKTSGQTETEINSFKAFTGSLALPQFLVANDSANIIGKVLNYQMDSIKVNRKFYANNKLLNDKNLSLKNSHIDTFTVSAAGADSLKLKYTAEKEAGNFDGEERSVPVYPQGVLESKGMFAALRSDTSFTFTPLADTGAIKIYAESSLLPILKDESEKIRKYEYLCNEQLASKIKALLVQKKIDSYANQSFKHEKQLAGMITLLNKNRNGNGLWGWWANNEPVIWISRHVIEALLQAEKAGYQININKQQLADFLVFNLETYRGTDKLNTISMLHQLNAKVDYQKYVDSIDAYYKRLKAADIKVSLYDQLKVVELKRQLGFEVDMTHFSSFKNETVFGNVYWGEDGYRFFDNSVQNTLLMYKIEKLSDNNADILERIRGYFFEKRKDGNWRNTYESSLILETILPDLLTDGKLPDPSELTIQDKELHTTTTYPYAITLQPQQKITIGKKGKQPVYFTAYQQFWNGAPEKHSNNFTVTTHFENGGTKISSLTAGNPVTLKAEVEVKADAEYVMVEIPIPAGCSYNDKNRGWGNNEVHREYFKNKTSIFCSSLKKGKYTFEISLLPRFTGTYHLNPAKAEMMYFPVFYGREGMKLVRVK